MKTQTAIALSVALAAIGLSTGYGLAGASEEASPLNKVGVVSVLKVMNECNKSAGHRQEAGNQQAQMQAELQQLAAALETENAALQTYVQGTEDYLAQLKLVVEKRAMLEAKQEYYRQSTTEKERQWTEELYVEVLEATNGVAQRLGLSLVLERTMPRFPMPAERFVLAVSGHKVLYAEGCVDITDAVLAEVNKNTAPAPAPEGAVQGPLIKPDN